MTTRRTPAAFALLAAAFVLGVRQSEAQSPALPPLTAGSSHTCGVASTGVPFCWGFNGQGGVGDSSTINRPTPVGVVALPAGVTHVTAGHNHSCGLAPGGAAYCWGANQYGQLGDGTTNQRTSAVLVQGASGLTFVQVAAGTDHTCGLVAGGLAYCWGENSLGQLGDGTTTQRSLPTIVAAPPGVTFTQLTAGDRHTCAVASNSRAYCWGYNQSGRLGDGTTTMRLSPVQVLGPLFKQVEAGWYHSCGVSLDGRGYCWGANNNGQLGDGTTTVRRTPVAVLRNVTYVQITAGGTHSCAVINAGGITCWGANQYGKLGDGTTAASSIPTVLQGADGIVFAWVSAGGAHTCGMTGTGVAYCWGSGQFGELGNGAFSVRLTPAMVALPPS